MPNVEPSCVSVDKHNGIAWVSLNRPHKKNAMSPQLHEEMDGTLADLEHDDGVGAVVILGAGGNFSAGQDLKEFFRALENDPVGRKRAQETANRWRWDRLYMYGKPTISMVEGYCAGGAFMQLMATDFALASEDAVFSLSEINWGIIPGGLVAKVVVDAVLYRHALYYACLGEPFDGLEAARVGFVNKAFPKGDLKEETEKLAVKLMAKSPPVLRATKQALRQVRTMTFQQAYDYLAQTGQALRTEDAANSYQTGMRKFVDEKAYRPMFEPFKPA